MLRKTLCLTEFNSVVFLYLMLYQNNLWASYKDSEKC